MSNTNKTYRVRTKIGDESPNVLYVPINQSYDMFEILSLKLSQKGKYKTFESDYGVIVGRVLANGGFGVENAKVSIFIPYENKDKKEADIYAFLDVNSQDKNGVKYNLLPDSTDDECHQNVGTFPNKRYVLDNDDVLEVFDKYWKFTTTTNRSGDYFIMGVPKGSQKLHCDIDLSDCGVLSQKPRDMISNGYNEGLFESPNKFKYSTNLKSLAHIISQDKGVYVYPYWGDTSDNADNFAITRCDINIEYEFKPYAVFMGSIITDTWSNSINEDCSIDKRAGKMSDLVTGEGTIEMIRKTINGNIEEFPIKGNRLIDSDGVWCYNIPLNLDYITMDEFGNIIPTDNPKKGIPTRARVRFRVSLDENKNDSSARKRCKYLIPNNPKMGDKIFDEELKPDYEFGSNTRDESFCDLFWNNVYTVKNYIPKLHKGVLMFSGSYIKEHSGIKAVNHFGDNNPFPYNSMSISLPFLYRIICVIAKMLILLTTFVNFALSTMLFVICGLATWSVLGFKIFKPLQKMILQCINFEGFCKDKNNEVVFPGCFGCVWDLTKQRFSEEQFKKKEGEVIYQPINDVKKLHNCVENELAEQNEAVSFNFNNDWVNGVLYAPIWYRKIQRKRNFFFGLIPRKAKDEWCSSSYNYETLKIIEHCALNRFEKGDKYYNFEHKQEITPYYVNDNFCDKNCNEQREYLGSINGVIHSKKTMLGHTVYYYVPAQYDSSLNANEYNNLTKHKQGEIKTLFATDIVLLGNLNECNIGGIPQFFKYLDSTTYNMPPNLLLSDVKTELKKNKDNEVVDVNGINKSIKSGCDWGNPNEYGVEDGGLFYDIGCNTIKIFDKSCVNLSRICEYGVSLDETKEIPNMKTLENEGDNAFSRLVTDGFISYDEINNSDGRAMFATLNGNSLKTKLNQNNGLLNYEFFYLYPENFDGSLHKIMENRTKGYYSGVSYKNNYKLEDFNKDYYIFRMGNMPYFYSANKDSYDRKSFPRYENSFYFYFGLKIGKTAIEKFSSKYLAECNNSNSTEKPFTIITKPNKWCSELPKNNNCDKTGESDGHVLFNFKNVKAPYDLLINSLTYLDFSLEVNGITEEKVYISNKILKGEGFSSYNKLKKNTEGKYDQKGVDIPMLKNGEYHGVLTDENGEISEFMFTIEGERLKFNTEVQSFKKANNVLLQNFNNDYKTILNNKDEINFDENTYKVSRKIGGVITLFHIKNGNEDIDEYEVEIRPTSKINGYDGITFTNKNYSGVEGLNVYKVNGNLFYGINVPKGDEAYTVKVTELCCGMSSNNYKVNKVYVSEPKPYKLFINDVDYDLIKNFNKTEDGTTYTSGWKPSGTLNNKNTTFNNEKEPRKVVFEGNPWFNIDKVWSNNEFKNISKLRLIEYDILKELPKNISSNSPKYVNIDEDFYVLSEDKSSYKPIDFKELIKNKTINIVTEDGTAKFELSKLINEFTKAKVNGENKVYYNWDGEYIVNGFNEDSFLIEGGKTEDYINLLNNFLDKVNRVIEKRNELPNLMEKAFFITCLNGKKTIDLRVETDSLPGMFKVAYQKESEQENSEVNTLKNNSLTVTNETVITKIDIPTITYASNNNFGVDGAIDFKPVVSKVKNKIGEIYKHAYYVGCVNKDGDTIPLNLESDDKKVYREIRGDNELSKLFDFPIIDKIFNLKYVAWTAFDNIPFYKRYKEDGSVNKEKVNMNGLFAGNIFNGNIQNEKLKENVYDIYGIKFSDNVTNENETYIKQRVIKDVEGDNYDRGKYHFKKYIVFNNEKLGGNVTQYIPVTKETISYSITDFNDCSIEGKIFGNTKILLGEESVNDCISRDESVLSLKVDGNNPDDKLSYSVIPLGDNTYPLNHTVPNGNSMEEKIEDGYTKDKTYNIFSYKTTSKQLREISDKNFYPISIDDNNVATKEDKIGYSSISGIFKANKNVSYPVYCVIETGNKVRTISPVYDFSNVTGICKYGIVERQDIVKVVDEKTGETTYKKGEITKDYKIGIAVKGGSQNYENQFYLEKYPFTLSGWFKLDEIDKVDFVKTDMSQSDTYTFTNITENFYKKIKDKSNFYKNFLSGKYHTFCRMEAVDYVGLRHKFSIVEFPNETQWYTCIWHSNRPNKKTGIEHIENDKSAIIDSIEVVYEKGSKIVKKDCISDNENRFIGWSENEPNGKIIDVFPDKIDENKIYYGNWENGKKVRVNFYDSDKKTLLKTIEIEKGTTVSPPETHKLNKFYEEVNGEKVIWNWGNKVVKNIDLYLNQKVSLIFNVKDNGGVWQDNTTADYIMFVDADNEYKCDKTPKHKEPERYEFIGWSVDKNSKNPVDKVYIGFKDLVVYPIFRPTEMVDVNIHITNMLNNFINNANLYISKFNGEKYAIGYLVNFGGNVTPNGGTRDNVIKVYKQELDKGLEFSGLVIDGINKNSYDVRFDTKRFDSYSTGPWNFTIVQK